MVLLNTSKISKSYGETVILSDISFNVTDNDTAAQDCLGNVLAEAVSHGHIGAGIVQSAADGNQLCIAGTVVGTVIE